VTVLAEVQLPAAYAARCDAELSRPEVQIAIALAGAGAVAIIAEGLAVRVAPRARAVAVLHACGYDRQADFVADLEPALGTPIVLIYADGAATVGVSPRTMRGAA